MPRLAILRRPSNWTVPLIRFLAACGFLLAGAGVVRATLPPEQPGSQATQAEAERLLAVVKPVGDFVIGSISPDGYVFNLKRDGHQVGDLAVGFADSARDRPRVRSAHYQLEVFNMSVDPGADATLVRAANAVVRADGGAVPELPARTPDAQTTELIDAVLLAFVIAVALALWRRGRIEVEIRKPHVIQACVHTSIFLYWSLYWPAVGKQAPMILLMLALAFASDAAFSFARHGKWRVGLGPFPVVFSTNLFVWLDWRGAVLAMVGAFATKYYVQRNGRHIFNPSVAGLTLNAICTIAFPDLIHFGGLFHTLNIAPDMAEWIFLGSLIPLTMFRLLPVSIGSIIGLYYLTSSPGALRPTLLLMMTLLATDPATTPKTDFGRLLFGMMVGITYFIFAHLLLGLGQPIDFAKILSVPIPNLLVPQFDWLAARIVMFIRRRRDTFVARSGAAAWPTASHLADLASGIVPVPGAALVATWALLFTFALTKEKPQDFEPLLHWTWGTPLVVRDSPEGVPTCAGNPVFCRPFSFPREAGLWLTRDASGSNTTQKPAPGRSAEHPL